MGGNGGTRIAVLGAGSLGTIVGALLSRAGLDMVLVDVKMEHVDALNSEGARVEGQMEFTTPVKAITPANGRYLRPHHLPGEDNV